MTEDNIVWGTDFTKGRDPTIDDLYRAMMTISGRPLSSPIYDTREGDEFVGPDEDSA